MKPPFTDRAFEAWALLDRFDRLGDSVPIEPEEQQRRLAALGISAKKELQRSQALVAVALSRAKDARFQRARREREAAAQAALLRERPRRTRQENLGLIAWIASQVPAGQELIVQHRGFESAPDEDVDSLAAELEALLEMTRGK